MRADSIVFGIAGVLFGVIVGWVLGSQQPRGGRVATAVPRGPEPACRSDRADWKPRRAGGPGAGQGARVGRAAEPEGCPASRPAWQPLLRRRTISARPSTGTSRCTSLEQSRRRTWSTDLGVAYYYTQPAGPRDQAVRALVVDRSEAPPKDAPQHGHRARIREAGFQARPRRGKRSSRSLPTARKARPRRKELEGPSQRAPARNHRSPA